MKQFSETNILLFNDEPYYTDGENYYSRANWGKLVSSLAPYVKEVFYAVPVRLKNNNDYGIKIISENITYVPLPFWSSLAASIIVSLKYFRKLNATIKSTIKKCDLVYLRLPSLIAFLFFIWAKILRKSIVIYIGGNILTQANPSIQGSLLSRLLSKLVSYAIHFANKIVVKYSSITFVKGYELLELYKNKRSPVISYVTSLVSKEHIMYSREDTCNKEVIHILRVSQLLPSKGIEYLIEAIKMLKDNGYNIQLDIIGKSVSSEYELHLKNLVANLQLEMNVTFHGFVPFGQVLFEFYKNADISVISSLSEDSPRTIVESFAFGLPVVATKVGGIPDIILNEVNGLLVLPKSAVDIYKAILKIITDKKLRRKLIRNSLTFAENHSEENQAITMLKTIEQYVP